MQIPQEELRKFPEEYSLAGKAEQGIVFHMGIALGMSRKSVMCRGAAMLEHGCIMPKLQDMQQAERLEPAQLW